MNPFSKKKDDDKILMSFYISNKFGDNVLKLFFECSLLYLEDFIYKMYTLIQDIPYLEDIFNSDFLDYMEYFSPFK